MIPFLLKIRDTQMYSAVISQLISVASGTAPPAIHSRLLTFQRRCWATYPNFYHTEFSALCEIQQSDLAACLLDVKIDKRKKGGANLGLKLENQVSYFCQ